MNEEYQAYLRSRPWKQRVALVISRGRHVCERCERATIDHVHHLTYEHIFNEPLTDLLGVCEDCHRYLHGYIDHDPCDFVYGGGQ